MRSNTSTCVRTTDTNKRAQIKKTTLTGKRTSHSVFKFAFINSQVKPCTRSEKKGLKIKTVVMQLPHNNCQYLIIIQGSCWRVVRKMPVHLPKLMRDGWVAQWCENVCFYNKFLGKHIFRENVKFHRSVRLNRTNVYFPIYPLKAFFVAIEIEKSYNNVASLQQLKCCYFLSQFYLK